MPLPATATLAALAKVGVALDLFWGGTLVHKDDLSFNPATDLPATFSQFRTAVERKWMVRPLAALTVSGMLKPLPAFKEARYALGVVPSMEDLGYPAGVEVSIDPRSVLPFAGVTG